MDEGFDDPKVVDINTFRLGVAKRSENDKFKDALYRQREDFEQNNLTKDANFTDSHLITEVLRDEVMEMIKSKLSSEGLSFDHPNYWVIYQALEEMIEVGHRLIEQKIMLDLMAIDPQFSDRFDPLDFSAEISEDYDPFHVDRENKNDD